MHPVTVEMFIDISCPWCHGALETNRRLLDELAADAAVPPLALHWRFMRLHPLPRPDGLPLEEYWDLVGDGPVDHERMRTQVRDFVRSVGVRVDFGRYTYVHDPFTAHRLLVAVRDDGGDDVPSLWSLARIVSNANFVQGLEIADHAVLRGAVERGGLHVPRRVWELVAADQGNRERALADHARALEVQLDGVPRMVVGGTIVPTWVDPDDVRRQLRAAIGAAAQATPPLAG